MEFSWTHGQFGHLEQYPHRICDWFERSLVHVFHLAEYDILSLPRDAPRQQMTADEFLLCLSVKMSSTATRRNFQMVKH